MLACELPIKFTAQNLTASLKLSSLDFRPETAILKPVRERGSRGDEPADRPGATWDCASGRCSPTGHRHPVSNGGHRPLHRGARHRHLDDPADNGRAIWRSDEGRLRWWPVQVLQHPSGTPARPDLVCRDRTQSLREPSSDPSLSVAPDPLVGAALPVLRPEQVSLTGHGAGPWPGLGAFPPSSQQVYGPVEQYGAYAHSRGDPRGVTEYEPRFAGAM